LKTLFHADVIDTDKNDKPSGKSAAQMRKLASEKQKRQH